MAIGDLVLSPWTKTKNAFFKKYYINRLFSMKNRLKTCNQDRELLNIIKIGNQEPEL